MAKDVRPEIPAQNALWSDFRAIESILTMYRVLGLPMPEEITPGQVLRIFRALRGWKVTELAEISGVDRLTIKAFENDERSPHGDTVSSLEKVFGQNFREAILHASKNQKRNKS